MVKMAEDIWDKKINKFCAACEKYIDYSVNEKLEQGWMEWAVEPFEGVYACSYECAYDIELNY
jgi:hypothetical protein